MTGRRGLVVYGAGGLARELAWLVEQLPDGPESWTIQCFVDDRPERQGTMLLGVPVLSLDEADQRHRSDCSACVAVGRPVAREALASRLEGRGFEIATVVHPGCYVSPRTRIGEGTIVQAGSVPTIDVRIGRHVLLNGRLSIGHDTTVGDFSTLGPGVNVSGRVRIGRRVQIGTGATIINGTEEALLQIGDDAIIGAGACVVGPVEVGATVVGVPARRIR
jgi:sugar O-acyltransferase (sialic acid O-acetyltransferase NeuD family)